MITPKRISYAHEKERELYESLIALTNSRQSEIQKLILQAVDDIQETLLDQACSLDITGRNSRIVIESDIIISFLSPTRLFVIV